MSSPSKRPLIKRSQIKRPLIGGVIVATLVAGCSLLAAPPAFAAAGDTAASGASASIDFAGIDDSASVGSVATTGAGEQTYAQDDVVLFDESAVSMTAGNVTTEASSDVYGSSANSSVSALAFGLDLGFLGQYDILGVESATAEATCTTGGTPTAEADFSGFTFLGASVEDANSVPPQQILGSTVSVTIDTVEDPTTTTATAVAFTATISATGGFLTGSVSVTLASASCETPDAMPVSIVSASPDHGWTVGGDAVTLAGTGFNEYSTVTVGGVPATISDVAADGTSLVFATPPGAEGLADIAVTNPGGSANAPFTYELPYVTDVTPALGPLAGGTVVTVSGAGLLTTDTVSFGGVAATDVSIDPSGTSVTATAPAGIGVVDIVFTLSDGTELTAQGTYGYIAAPVVASIDPASGPASGGTVVEVTGEGFLPGQTTVSICNVTIAAGEVTVNEEGTTATFVTPACAAGEAQVVVSTVGGASSPQAYTYTAAATPAASLSNTGNNVPVLLLGGIAALLVILGAVIIVIRVRKKKSQD